MSSLGEWVSVRAAARAAGKSVYAVMSALKAGRLKGLVQGGRVYVNTEDVKELVVSSRGSRAFDEGAPHEPFVPVKAGGRERAGNGRNRPVKRGVRRRGLPEVEAGRAEK